MARWCLALSLICGIVCSSEGIAQTPGCAPNSLTRTQMVERFRGIVSATSNGATAVRASLDVPEMSQDSVLAVTDSATCAALSLAQAAHYSQTPVAVTAIRVGPTRFAIFDKGRKQGEWETVSIYNAQYTFLKKMHF